MSQFPIDPFEIAQREVERLWRDLVYHRLPASHFAEQAWAPPVDVVVADRSARVILELAGVPRENVRVRLHGRSLEIVGRRNPPAKPSGLHWHRAEIYFGDFQRVIDLPWEADERRVQALYRDGMLEIRVHAVAAVRRTVTPVRSGA